MSPARFSLPLVRQLRIFSARPGHRLPNRVWLLWFLGLAALARQGAFLEQCIGVEGFDLDTFVLDDGDIFSAGLALGFVLRSGNVQ